jgi:hypothetical protein
MALYDWDSGHGEGEEEKMRMKLRSAKLEVVTDVLLMFFGERS